MMNKKRYLGDGAYVNFDGYNVVLTAENGIEAYETIGLEPQVLDNFLNYVQELKNFIASYKEHNGIITETS
jgi:hypothetical protein